MIPSWWRTPPHGCGRRGRISAGSSGVLRTWHDRPFKRTHDLAALGSQCKGIDNSLDLLIDRLDDLSQYAWVYRYPTSLAEPQAPEVHEASALAHMILAEVVKRLPSEAREQAGT